MSAARLGIRAAALVAVPALAAAGLVAAGTTAAYAAPPASCGVTAIVANLNTIATLAGNTNQQLSSLSTATPGGQVQTAAANLSNQLNQLSNEFSADADALNGCPALSAADAKKAADAYSSAADAIQTLLSTVSSKRDIFAQFGLTGQIGGALRQLEGAADSYSFALIDVASAQSSRITGIKNSIDTALDNAINRYQEICIPSPLYPTILPICISL